MRRTGNFKKKKSGYGAPKGWNTVVRENGYAEGANMVLQHRGKRIGIRRRGRNLSTKMSYRRKTNRGERGGEKLGG